MALIGALLLALLFLAPAWRGGSVQALSLGFRSMLYAAFPAFIVMRAGAEWIYDKQGYGDEDPDWLGLGYVISDLGFLLLLIATIVAGVAVRRARGAATEAGTLASRVPIGIVSLLLVLYLIAVWTMTTKPGG